MTLATLGFARRCNGLGWSELNRSVSRNVGYISGMGTVMFLKSKGIIQKTSSGNIGPEKLDYKRIGTSDEYHMVHTKAGLGRARAKVALLVSLALHCITCIHFRCCIWYKAHSFADSVSVVDLAHSCIQYIYMPIRRIDSTKHWWALPNGS